MDKERKIQDKTKNRKEKRKKFLRKLLKARKRYKKYE